MNQSVDISYLCAEGNPGGRFAFTPFWVDKRGRLEMGSQETQAYGTVLNQLYGSNDDDLEFLFFNASLGERNAAQSWQKFYMWKNRKKWG